MTRLQDLFDQELKRGPGPMERHWTSRLYFWIFRHWPASVVDERLTRASKFEQKLMLEQELQNALAARKATNPDEAL